MSSTGRMTLVAAILLLATTHVIPHEDVKKTPEDALDWWETAVFYQVYTRSFKDSDGDGIGDLQGMTENLDYLSDLGVSAVCLAPIFSSPMVDFGYDIDNYIDIDPIFGTLKDFERLVEKAKRLGIKVILDFVPNHTSKQHEWFLKSREREEPYTDYYVWRDSPRRSTSTRPPNNWLSVFGGSAWTWDNVRGQYYLHQFTEDQPDLNFRCPAVRQEMKGVKNLVLTHKEVLRFWLGRGAFGFRVDAVSHLFEDYQFRDEPESVLDAEDWEYTFLEHPLTRDLSQNYWLVQEWRQVLDEFASGVDNVTRVIMTESYSDIKDTMAYYGSSEMPGVHFPLNFVFITKLNNFCEAEEVKNAIKHWMTKLPENKSANWVLGNHDVPRVAARFGPSLVDAFNMLLMVLPGVAVTYNGEEIGMEDTFISWEQTKDPNGLYVGSRRYTKFSRDPQRTPFQWDTSTSAGFSSNKSTWLPVNDNYMKLNLQSQKLAKESHYHVYKRLVQARRSTTLQKGDVDIQAVSKYVLTIFRYVKEMLPP
uniref:alpha-glucosidase n=1 Tax=Timema tahoe TaxID=61484 RepID=A0A7R9FE43_9NEOP|nr:unnamed protein product [Timema tahoe]